VSATTTTAIRTTRTSLLVSRRPRTMIGHPRRRRMGLPRNAIRMRSRRRRSATSPYLSPPSSSEHPRKNGRGPSPPSPSQPHTLPLPSMFKRAKIRAEALSSVIRHTRAVAALSTTVQQNMCRRRAPASIHTRVTMPLRNTHRFRSPAHRRPQPPMCSSGKPILSTRETGFKIRVARSTSHPRSSPTFTIERSGTNLSRRAR
jgi:hypothetical protein